MGGGGIGDGVAMELCDSTYIRRTIGVCDVDVAGRGAVGAECDGAARGIVVVAWLSLAVVDVLSDIDGVVHVRHVIVEMARYLHVLFHHRRVDLVRLNAPIAIISHDTQFQLQICTTIIRDIVITNDR